MNAITIWAAAVKKLPQMTDVVKAFYFNFSKILLKLF